MEDIGILPNRWNGPIKREHLSEQRHAWSQEKNQTHLERLSQYETLAADLETVSIQHAESIEIDKALQEKSKALRLRSKQDISSKQEIKIIQKEIEIEKEKRRVLKIKRTGLKKTMQELKDFGLNGSHINGRRPTSSTPAPTADTSTTTSNTPHSDVENPQPLVPNVNEHLGMFTLVQISIFKNKLKAPF